MVFNQPLRPQPCKELVRHPENSPCFSHMLKYNWPCPKANQIYKSCVSNIWMGCHLAMACQSGQARAVSWCLTVYFMGLRVDCLHFCDWHPERKLLSPSGLSTSRNIKEPSHIALGKTKRALSLLIKMLLKPGFLTRWSHFMLNHQLLVQVPLSSFISSEQEMASDRKDHTLPLGEKKKGR